jgi:hypothetical protein
LGNAAARGSSSHCDKTRIASSWLNSPSANLFKGAKAIAKIPMDDVTKRVSIGLRHCVDLILQIAKDWRRVKPMRLCLQFAVSIERVRKTGLAFKMPEYLAKDFIVHGCVKCLLAAFLKERLECISKHVLLGLAVEIADHVVWSASANRQEG